MSNLPWITTKDFHHPKIHYGFLGKNDLVQRCYYQSKRATREECDYTRKTIMTASGLNPEDLSLLKQIHSDRVLAMDKPQILGTEFEADGQVTNKPGMILGILTADCVPVLFVDIEQMIIGATHAGWRGAIGGVLEQSLVQMKALGAQNIQAIIGPCIHQESYEVGPEFYEQFVEENKQNSQFFINSPREKYYLFDLPGYVQQKLTRLNLTNIYDLNLDTLKHQQQFYSFRRSTLAQESLDGENIAIIMIKND